MQMHSASQASTDRGYEPAHLRCTQLKHGMCHRRPVWRGHAGQRSCCICSALSVLLWAQHVHKWAHASHTLCISPELPAQSAL